MSGSSSRWDDWMGLGVAGNFAGHLEQAGEAGDFENLASVDERAPKGVFPFYVPGEGSHFLHCDPVSSNTLRLGSDAEKHQIEPEVALLCELEYDGDRVVAIVPREAMAHNDCSIRRPGASKISEKKNWGPASKGTASDSIPIDRFESGGALDRFRLASYLLRDGELVEYGVDSEVASYTYMYEELLAWLVDRLNHQRDEGPLEDLASWRAIGGQPARALISIGATRYTAFGETTFLQRGDCSIVVLYDAARHDAGAIQRLAREWALGSKESRKRVERVSFLCQEVV